MVGLIEESKDTSWSTALIRLCLPVMTRDDGAETWAGQCDGMSLETEVVCMVSRVRSLLMPRPTPSPFWLSLIGVALCPAIQWECSFIRQLIRCQSWRLWIDESSTPLCLKIRLYLRVKLTLLEPFSNSVKGYIHTPYDSLCLETLGERELPVWKLVHLVSKQLPVYTSSRHWATLSLTWSVSGHHQSNIQFLAVFDISWLKYLAATGVPVFTS